MTEKIYNLLFLCTGNSARSIMAEAMANHLGNGRVRAFSAGSHPTGRVNPFAVETLRRMHVPVDHLRSKSWDEFAVADAPTFDFIITVCDNAAGEVCPIWPGQPMAAHWGVEDPAAFDGSDDKKLERFHEAAATLRRRIELLLSLPLGKIDTQTLRTKLREIGER